MTGGAAAGVFERAEYRLLDVHEAAKSISSFLSPVTEDRPFCGSSTVRRYSQPVWGRQFFRRELVAGWATPRSRH